MRTEELKVEFSKWGKRELELTHRRRELEANAASIMLEMGSGTTAAGNDCLERVLLEVRTAELAIRSARDRRTAAVKSCRESRGAEHQERADELRKESQGITLEVDQLKCKLTELLGVPIEVVPAAHGRPSRLQQLGLQIQNLSAKISSLQREGMPDSGTAEIEIATNVDSLFSAIFETEALIPSVESILKWAEDCEQATGNQVGNQPRRYRLVWRGGEIDLQQSQMFCEHLCSRIHATSHQPLGLDIASGTFRVAVARR